MDETREQDLATGEMIRLKQDICALVAGYQDSAEEPPFSAAEMVVMACCMNTDNTTGLEIWQISHHILNMFPYFQKRALRHYARMQDINVSQGEEVEHEEICDGFQDVFSRWEVPLVTRDDPNHEVYRWDEVGEDIYVPPQAGRIFLSRWLEPERKGTFPFLELPAELRNSIYEMVFSFPREGIVAAGAGPQLTVTRRQEQPVNPELVDAYVQGFKEYLGMAHDINAFELDAWHLNLDLLRVNRQVHDEALPVFFRANRFWCAGPAATAVFITHLSSRHAEHLRDLCVNIGYDHSMPGDFPAAMEKLARVKRLVRLRVRVDKDGWFRMRQGMRVQLGRKTKFTKYEQIPGFKELAVACSRAGILEWDGAQHRAIKGWVEGEMEKMKKVMEQGEKQEAGGKKKKAMGGKGGRKQIGGVSRDEEKPKRKARRVVLPRRTDSDGERDD